MSLPAGSTVATDNLDTGRPANSDAVLLKIAASEVGEALKMVDADDRSVGCEAVEDGGDCVASAESSERASEAVRQYRTQVVVPRGESAGTRGIEASANGQM